MDGAAGSGAASAGADAGSTRWLPIAAAAVPGVALAGFSLIHPAFLGPSTAVSWWQLHIPLVPVFPLLGVPILIVLRGERGVVAWVARIAAYLYACLYTALDTVSGIAAGLVTERTGGGATVGDLFAVGDGLGHLGIGCLAFAILVSAALLAGRAGPWVVPGVAVLLVACWGFLLHHIFSPEGTWSMLGFALGFALLAAARRPPARRSGDVSALPGTPPAR